MTNDVKLTNDQEERIRETLKRIRSGLNRKQTDQLEEPAHLFVPEAFNAKEK